MEQKHEEKESVSGDSKSLISELDFKEEPISPELLKLEEIKEAIRSVEFLAPIPDEKNREEKIKYINEKLIFKTVEEAIHAYEDLFDFSMNLFFGDVILYSLKNCYPRGKGIY